MMAISEKSGLEKGYVKKMKTGKEDNRELIVTKLRKSRDVLDKYLFLSASRSRWKRTSV